MVGLTHKMQTIAINNTAHKIINHKI